jgi:Leucine-rich repeat (LRR) protein
MYCNIRRNHSSLFPKISLVKLLLVFIIIIFPATASSAIAQTCTGIPDGECQALYALYNGAGGDQWTDNTNWLSSEEVSGWYGVTVAEGHVTMIDLHVNNLTGSIPSELGNLDSLAVLDLTENNLTGSIPTEFGNLTSLTHIYLNDNSLTDSIPPELGNLTSLTHLYLYDNNLTGSIPAELGNLTSLIFLYLSGNNLSGSIPPELGNLTRLTRFSLAYMNLTGSIPPELGNMTNLMYLYFQSNNLTGSIPPELGDLTNLRYLALQDNNLTGSIPPELGNPTSLTHFFLDGNNLTGSIPSALGNLTSVKYLYLYENQLTGSIPPELGDLSELLLLRLHSNNLSGNLPAFLLSSPPELNLKWNCLYASDPAVLAAMESKHSNMFMSTQTVEPENISAAAVSDSGNSENRVEVSWDPIVYTDDPGGYKVFYRKTGDTGFKNGGMTHNKEASSFRVSNLEPGTEYEFMVNAITWQHQYNKSDLYSRDSDRVSTVSGTLARAFIPVWKQSPGYFTGVVVANFGDTDFDVDLAAYDPDGVIEPQGQRHQAVEAGKQMSKLGSEFFHGNPYHEDFSWIELGAENSNRMGSIFLYGVSDTQMLDGAEAQSTYAKKLYFTRPLDEGFFAGWGPDLQMCIVNPTDEEVTITCTTKGSNGESENTHVIPARGFIKGDAEDLTNTYHGIVDGYLEIEVTDGPGVVGFARIEFPGVRTALGMNAIASSPARTMYSAQLAHGSNIVTNLRLVNTGGVSRTVTLTAIGDTGTPLADPAQVNIDSEQIYSADLGTLFGLEGEGTIHTGSLVVESDGNGIIGDIIFADGDTLEYAMSLPLQDKLFKEAVFNHIANLPTIFTGFAFYNPGDATATVLIEAIGTDGTKVAEKTLILDPGERIARTLMDSDMWPTFENQSGGYIKIQSDQPIAGQQLFGDTTLRYMAAIPPTTRAEAMFD